MQKVVGDHVQKLLKLYEQHFFCPTTRIIFQRKLNFKTPIVYAQIKFCSILKFEAFHYNTTNQCNHYVTELFDIKICYAKQKLKSIKKTIIKIGQAVSEISLYLCFGPH